MGEGRPRDVAAQTLEAMSVVRGDSDAGVEAHLVVPSNEVAVAWRRGVSCSGLDPIAEPPPALAGLGARGNPSVKRGLRQPCEQRVVAGGRVLGVDGQPAFEQPRDTPCSAGEHAGDFLGCGLRQREELGRAFGDARIGLVHEGAVEREGCGSGD